MNASKTSMLIQNSRREFPDALTYRANGKSPATPISIPVQPVRQETLENRGEIEAMNLKTLTLLNFLKTSDAHSFVSSTDSECSTDIDVNKEDEDSDGYFFFDIEVDSSNDGVLFETYDSFDDKQIALKREQSFSSSEATEEDGDELFQMDL